MVSSGEEGFGTMNRRNAEEMLRAAEARVEQIASQLIIRAQFGKFDGDLRPLYHALRELADRSIRIEAAKR